jgi:hypothetical protein
MIWLNRAAIAMLLGCLQPKLVSGQRAVATCESPLPEPALGLSERLHSGTIEGRGARFEFATRVLDLNWR